MKLYQEEELQTLLKKTKDSFVAFIVFVCLSFFSAASFIGFAFYEARTLFEILGAIITLAFAYFALYFFDRNRYFRRLSTEYLNLYSEAGEEGVYEIVTLKSRPITLSDRSNVYELIIKKEGMSKTVYLSSLFEPLLEEGKRYRLLIALNYVKEYDEVA